MLGGFPRVFPCMKLNACWLLSHSTEYKVVHLGRAENIWSKVGELNWADSLLNTSSLVQLSLATHLGFISME